VMNPQLHSTEAGEDGSAIKKMIAAGGGVPMHFLAEPEGSTRTTAEAAGGPTFRHYQQRQVFFKWLIQDLAQIVVRRRAMLDRHISVKSDIEVQAPDISSRDNAALAVAAGQIVTAISQIHDQGLIPDDELLRLAYTFAGETVDVEEILARSPRVPQQPVGAHGGAPGTGAPTAGAGGAGSPKNQYNVSQSTGEVTIPAEKQ
jgi:hypothetical protein